MLERILISHEAQSPGPLVIVVAALHGNEWVGINALKQISQHLTECDQWQGKLVGIVGNRAAASKKQRFIDADLNRLFLPERLEQQTSSSEWREAHELITTINEQIASYPEATAVHLFDMHSMSGGGVPFTCFPMGEANAKLAKRLPLPAIADLVEILPGTLSAYFSGKVDTSVVVECGQHEAQETMDIGAYILGFYLSLTGNVAEPLLSDVPASLGCVDPIRDVFTRVTYRHAITSACQFKMNPGYANLQAIALDEALACDKNGVIRSQYNGRMVLPCYQPQGDDGFFIAVDE